MQLFAHPGQLAMLREHPEHIPHAVEELLRVDTSVMGLFRVTTRDSELGGVTIPAGARVWVLYSAANHDAEQFPHPERLDITRDNAREHMALGKGIHVCIGAPLARLELRTRWSACRTCARPSASRRSVWSTSGCADTPRCRSPGMSFGSFEG